MVLSIEWRSATGRERTAHVPENAPLFTGHFPGRPILPGYALMLAASRAATEDLGRPFRAFKGVRFRNPVGPGTDLRLTLEGKTGGPITFKWRTENESIADGTGLPTAGPASDWSPSNPETPPPPLPFDPLPHRGTARFAVELLQLMDEHTPALVRGAVPLDHPLVHDGRVPTLAAIELAAQAVACAAPLGDGPPAAGFLAGVRRVDLFLPDLPAGAELIAAVTPSSRAGPVRIATFAVSHGNVLAATGQLTAYIPVG